MKYLLLLHRGAAEDLPDPGSAESARLFSAYESAVAAMATAGGSSTARRWSRPRWPPPCGSATARCC